MDQKEGDVRTAGPGALRRRPTVLREGMVVRASWNVDELVSLLAIALAQFRPRRRIVVIDQQVGQRVELEPELLACGVQTAFMLTSSAFGSQGSAGVVLDLALIVARLHVADGDLDRHGVDANHVERGADRRGAPSAAPARGSAFTERTGEPTSALPWILGMVRAGGERHPATGMNASLNSGSTPAGRARR